MSKKTASDDGFTPLMRQFHAVKEQHPDKILFFRMGDFYEMFGDDAVKAAPVLDIALTSRSHGKGGERIPLAGVPHHSADRYLARLLANGFRVVIVEQVEDPKTAKGLVKRDVVEILTPGTATIDSDDTRLGGSLCALYSRDQKSFGLAWIDLNTGAFVVDEGSRERMTERSRLLEPAELIYPSEWKAEDLSGFVNGSPSDHCLTEFGDWNFDRATAERELNQHFGTSTLDGFGVGETRLAVTAAGAIFRYLKENHRDRLDHVRKLARIDDSESMLLDYSTVRNLELIRSVADGTERNTLYGVMNRCQTAAGARKLRQALIRPFRSRARIERRLGGVGELVKNRDLTFHLRETIKGAPDLQKLAGRLGLGKLSPRQAGSVSSALKTCQAVRKHLSDATSEHLRSIAHALPDSREISDRLDQALVEEPPLVSSKGGILRRGYSDDLDRLNDSIKDAREYIAALQPTERRRTGINTLKVGFNKVFGYYIEVTRLHSDEVPEEYIRKQTLVNAERFITPELKEKERLILEAEEKIFALETRLFEELIAWLNGRIGDILISAEMLAETDLNASLAELAVENGYCRPEIDEGDKLTIVEGRHPVVEAVLPPGSFVSNEVTLSHDKDRIVILTGPNMSGKSTYLRQIGLIVVMAQIGSFVPAAKAEIGLVDRVFTRVGAMDNLAGGQSTFLVEMVETANILNNATERSLVLLDEVGRGTSTFDGLSVAWSVVERIHDDCCCRTVFATHYHELTGMAQLYEAVSNYQVSVKRWKKGVIFLHKIIEGGCDDSYGIEVAKLAGLPRQTIGRARQILKLLESGKFTQSELGRGIYKEKVQTTLFEQPDSVIEEQLREVDIEQMTPVQAMEFLDKLKKELD